MFGQNQRHTPRAFDGLPDDALLVTSIFPTIQGEGPFSGCPAVFLRLTFCHLACKFCDTYFDRGEVMRFKEINEKLAEAAEAFPMRKTSPPMLVITGGEPLLQPNLALFLQTREKLLEKTQIETTGSIYAALPWWAKLVISPKINDRTGDYVQVNKLLLKQAYFLKFVVSFDMPGYTDVPDWALAWRDQQPLDRRIYLSPMNMYKEQPQMPTTLADAKERAARERISFWTPGLLDLEANQRNHEYAARLAMKYSCNLSLQQHIYASLP